jgi:uncharacterized protein with PIN domain
MRLIVNCSPSHAAWTAMAEFNRFDAFWRCRDCRKIYWQGSHYHRMLERIRKIELIMISAQDKELS